MKSRNTPEATFSFLEIFLLKKNKITKINALSPQNTNVRAPKTSCHSKAPVNNLYKKSTGLKQNVCQFLKFKRELSLIEPGPLPPERDLSVGKSKIAVLPTDTKVENKNNFIFLKKRFFRNYG